MIAAVLSAAGYRTGLFSSRHLDRVEERMGDRWLSLHGLTNRLTWFSLVPTVRRSSFGSRGS